MHGTRETARAHSELHAKSHRLSKRPPFECIALLLQGGGALGSYQAGVYEALAEANRTPFTDAAGTKGRNHYARAFSALLAGGGVKGGTAYGETDEYGLNIVKNPCHVHDYHATILHLMGIDHTRLTYRYAGRDFRLTDVHGSVVREIVR